MAWAVRANDGGGRGWDASGANAPGRVDAVHAGHADIHQDQVEPTLLGGGDAGKAILGLGHIASLAWRSVSRATRRLMALSSTIRMLRPGQSGLATACWGTVSGATGAGSRGSVIRNAVPPAGLAWGRDLPAPMASTRPLTMLRPSPVPSTLRSKVEPNVTNASKILSRSAAGCHANTPHRSRATRDVSRWPRRIGTSVRP